MNVPLGRTTTQHLSGHESRHAKCCNQCNQKVHSCAVMVRTVPPVMAIKQHTTPNDKQCAKSELLVLDIGVRQGQYLLFPNSRKENSRMRTSIPVRYSLFVGAWAWAARITYFTSFVFLSLSSPLSNERHNTFWEAAVATVPSATESARDGICVDCYFGSPCSHSRRGSPFQRIGMYNMDHVVLCKDILTTRIASVRTCRKLRVCLQLAVHWK